MSQKYTIRYGVENADRDRSYEGSFCRVAEDERAAKMNEAYTRAQEVADIDLHHHNGNKELAYYLPFVEMITVLH